MSAFQKYWKNLRENNPEAYEEKLRVNRERIKNMRKAIYSDPQKHAEHKRRQREKYKLRISKLTKTSERPDAQSDPQRPSGEQQSGLEA